MLGGLALEWRVPRPRDGRRGTNPAQPAPNPKAPPPLGLGASTWNRAAQTLMKIPFKFMSSCCGFGEKRSASALEILPALTSRRMSLLNA